VSSPIPGSVAQADAAVDFRGMHAERDGKGEPVRDGVCIKEVRQGTMFSPALQAGDVVTAVDGTKAASQEVLRKLLRKQLARGGPRITFTVRRAGQTSTVSIPVKD
jgi:S1-C subfamily serine protease